ncbi:MAG: ABC transporter permease [Candidatus Pacebacteria bacterium]|nr:ABC transporter permease [Candidatus Paceibacterota bacterium]
MKRLLTWLSTVRADLAHAGISAVVILLVLLIWQAITARGFVSPNFIPTPASVWRAFIHVTTEGYQNHTLLFHLGSSMLRMLTGFALACVLAIPLGLGMGTSEKLRAAIAPFIEFYRPLPPLAYYTILILWLGIGNASKIALLFLAAFPPIAINSMAGVQSVSEERIQAAQSLGAKRWQIFRYVIFPSCLPHIFTGMRVSIGFTYTTLVSAEIVAASHGIGWMVWNARRWPQSDVIFMGNIVMGATGILLAWLIKKAEQQVCPWHGKV